MAPLLCVRCLLSLGKTWRASCCGAAQSIDGLQAAAVGKSGSAIYDLAGGRDRGLSCGNGIHVPL